MKKKRSYRRMFVEYNLNLTWIKVNVEGFLYLLECVKPEKTDLENKY